MGLVCHSVDYCCIGIHYHPLIQETHVANQIDYLLSVMLIGYYMALVAYILMLAENTTFSASWTICLPFVAIILNWLAIRGIGADEALVKAYDRLR
jgi:hypothetical protein